MNYNAGRIARYSLVSMCLVLAPFSAAQSANATALAHDQASASDLPAPAAPSDDAGSAATGSSPDQAPPASAAAPARTGGGFFAYYAHESGKTGPDVDPNALPSRRASFPPQPVTTPPYPFTEWPYGATTPIGVTRANSVDSPFMAAIADTSFGKALSSAHIQAYGWINVGGNISTNHVKGGNAPAAYDYEPNKIQMDQAVLYIERTPDTVQEDHVDWGFRVSGLYGVDYRYTTSFGVFSNQLLKRNASYGYDAPMVYGEIYIPKIAKGMVLRFGRYISIPDIEAQLAPNNYMYSHSMTYTFDNYTNTGVVASVAVTKNLFLQAGVVLGTDTAFFNTGKRVTNPFPNPLYPGTTFLKDPGAKPSFVGCVRYQSNSARDNIYFCADGINNGVWGYNNLQWIGFTYYHKFTDSFHVAAEFYTVSERRVPNLNNPIAAQALANGGTPFSTPDFRYNAPGAAQCADSAALTCTASVHAALAYFNYQFAPLDNLSFRVEYFDDRQGQRTGVKTSYSNVAIGIQHWLSPQIEFRPEVAYYHANDANAFNGNSNYGVAPNKRDSTILSGDVILHF